MPTISLPSLLNHLGLSTLETPSILFLPAWYPRYIASGWLQQKTRLPNNSSIVTEACLPRRCIQTAVLLLLHAYSFQREMFTESLPSNEQLLWLQYSGFQASCYNSTNVLLAISFINSNITWKEYSFVNSISTSSFAILLLC
jgi:hypothetical protein